MNTSTAPSIVLVPGHWLSSWAWTAVSSRLTSIGFVVESVTLPGTSPSDEPGTSLTDQVDALTDVIGRQPSPPVLVAHSGAGRVATGAIDRQPDSVLRMIYVDSGPAEDGSSFDDSVGEDLTSLPLPAWADLEAGGASLEGISETDLATFRERAVAVPGGVLREPLHLSNEERLAVPSTIIACSLPSQQMMEFARQGHPMFAEVARLRELDTVDLPTGHWPMWSRPADLADAIAAASTD